MHSHSPNTQEVLSQWNRCHGAFYQVRASDLHWNLHAQSLLQYQTVFVEGVPVLFATASQQGLALGIPERSLWVSLWGEIAAGSEGAFLLGCESLAKSEKKERLVFCGEEFHFLPGVPIDEEAGLRLFAAASEHKFEHAEACDYVGDLNSQAVAEYIAGAQSRALAEQWALSLVAQEAEREKLFSFLKREFPGRWMREYEFWRNNVDACRASWFVLRDQSDCLVGFVRVALRSKLFPLDSGWTPGALRLPNRPSVSWLGEPSDSCLGPIGVAASERGRGAGKLLLGLALGELRKSDAMRICIDWTNAHNYYMPLRFEVARKFCSLWKRL
jgi:hypothetical protein